MHRMIVLHDLKNPYSFFLSLGHRSRVCTVHYLTNCLSLSLHIAWHCFLGVSKSKVKVIGVNDNKHICA